MINNLYIKATPAAASITWGSITGTLSSQTDLQNALDAKFDDPTGTVSQYVRGDGSLANFPSSSGGGSSLTFYLNGSVAQGTFGGVAFKEMDRIPVLGAGTDFTIATNGYIQTFITDANVPNLLEIPAGNWNFETYFSASSSGGTPSFYIELYKWNGTTLSLIASNSATPEGITNGTAIDLYLSAIAVPQTVLTVTDRLAVRIYVNNSGRTITLHTENSHLCEVITTFSTGLTALNGLTAQVQNLATGTSGTDFGISSATSTHTFNLPTASAANRGALSSADWTTFNNKQAALVSGTNIKTINGTTVLGSGDLVVGGGGGTPSGVAGSVQFSDGSAFSSDATNFFWDNTNKRLGVGTNTPTARTQIKGTGATNATTSVLVQNSAGTNSLQCTDDLSVFSHGKGAVTSNTVYGKGAFQGVSPSGINNTAIGVSTLAAVTSGGSNTGIGGSALGAVTTGTRNTVIGRGSYASGNGSDNTVIGEGSLFAGTGSKNTAVGQSITGNHSNCILLGYGASSGTNNQMVFGSFATPAGSVISQVNTSTQYWSVVINGVACKILLA
jgi:hypothetical protein